MKLESLLNHESRMDDEAMELSCPLEPRYAKPCDRFDRNKFDEKVDDAVEKRPLPKPMVVDVEL